MFDIGPEKIALLLLIALVVMGPQKLPEIARSIGRGLREFRQAASGVRDELAGGLTESPPPVSQGAAPLSGTAKADSQETAQTEEPESP